VLGQVHAAVKRGARDEDVLALLDGLVAGFKTGEICQRQGWTEQEHENVLRRLRTIAQGLPVSLRRELLRLAIEAVAPAAPVLLRASEADDDDPIGEEADGLSVDDGTSADASSDCVTSADAA